MLLAVERQQGGVGCAQAAGLWPGAAHGPFVYAPPRSRSPHFSLSEHWLLSSSLFSSTCQLPVSPRAGHHVPGAHVPRQEARAEQSLSQLCKRDRQHMEPVQRTHPAPRHLAGAWNTADPRPAHLGFLEVQSSWVVRVLGGKKNPWSPRHHAISATQIDLTQNTWLRKFCANGRAVSGTWHCLVLWGNKIIRGLSFKTV